MSRAGLLRRSQAPVLREEGVGREWGSGGRTTARWGACCPDPGPELPATTWRTLAALVWAAARAHASHLPDPPQPLTGAAASDLPSIGLPESISVPFSSGQTAFCKAPAASSLGLSLTWETGLPWPVPPAAATLPTPHPRLLAGKAVPHVRGNLDKGKTALGVSSTAQPRRHRELETARSGGRG